MKSSKEFAERVWKRLKEPVPDSFRVGHVDAYRMGIIESEVSEHTEELRREIARLVAEHS